MVKATRFRAGEHNLTELEGAVLASIARAGPCTPYVVKEAFRSSPSEFWSGSAGAIYPVVERLAQRGLIGGERDRGDRRGRRNYSITEEGRRALRLWLTDVDRAATFGFDPLRTRLFFSDLLPAASLKSFVAAAERRLKRGTEVPSSWPPHAADLHKLWLNLRLNALQAFASRKR